MQFVIRRVGSRDHSPPCDGAIESDDIFHTYVLHANLPYHPELTKELIDSLRPDDEIPGHASTKEKWFSEGRNHRFENGKWQRDIHAFVIEIESLEELLDLQSKVDCPLIINHYANEQSITIYDDYIE